LRNGENSFTGPNLESALNDSLKRLKTDYIDLYQLHWPERNVNNFGRLGYVHKENEWNKFEDVLAELNKYIDQGKIRYVGLSNETPWGVLNYLQLSKDKKLPRMMSIQNPYSLLNRSYEVGLAEVSIRENIGCLAYSPLASGYLSGKYRNRNFPKGSRMERDFDFQRIFWVGEEVHRVHAIFCVFHHVSHWGLIDGFRNPFLNRFVDALRRW